MLKSNVMRTGYFEQDRLPEFLTYTGHVNRVLGLQAVQNLSFSPEFADQAAFFMSL